ncbi:acetylornithine transaminase [Paenibacillus sp. MY03]|uniref:aspartate aminotransferase family protein n=1 Tax=Paenibacillus sp. MY03 TaxID=302980 RepID=UPI000B3C3D68|nr:aminotransferase class III-fold pyridoxal phosphate-dependent enzyme [Paenibacillus sp. MY03]OUS78235.1 acetylornithine transaminase [Paenibacillus sp. MY03]
MEQVLSGQPSTAASTTAELLQAARKHLLFTANRPEIVMASGQGMYIQDTEGRSYIDFVGGWAVNALGHSPAVLREALTEQASRLVLASPAYFNEPMIRFAELLTGISGMDKAFFGSTGAEANECAVKLARKHGALHLDGAYEIITMRNSFHGRTLAMMSATGKQQWESLFEPKVPGFIHVPMGDLDACFSAVSNRTCAIMLELVQGEGGVHAVDEAYLFGLRKICDMYGIALIFDEVQTGLGRTGKLFAWEHYGIKPDIMTLGKGIGGGYPLSATLAVDKFNLFEPGDQGGTYIGQPLGMAVGYAVVRELLDRRLTENAQRQGGYLLGKLRLLESHNLVRNPRGLGLLAAFDMPNELAAKLAARCMELGLLVNVTGESTIRLMPPLIAEQRHIDEMADILTAALLDIS